MAMTSVQFRPEPKDKLNNLKLHPRETYDELIDHLANAAYDDEELSDEEIADLRTSEKDIESGRTLSLKDIMKDPGDDKVIRSFGE